MTLWDYPLVSQVGGNKVRRVQPQADGVMLTGRPNENFLKERRVSLKGAVIRAEPMERRYSARKTTIVRERFYS